MKISLITVTYNSDKTLFDTFQSVLNQSYPEIEYIIIDGASKDNTVSIIKEYEPQFDGRMKWISEPDKGLYDAMNKGILRSSGGIIGIVNSDDWLESVALDNVAKSFEENGHGVNSLYCGDIVFHYHNGET